MLMQRLHKINQSGRIKIAFGELKHKMASRTDGRSDSNPNAFLARNSDHWTNFWKRPSLAHMRNQKESSLVSIKDQPSGLPCTPLDLGQNILLPLTNLLGILFQRSALGTLANQSQSSQKPTHMFGVKPDTELLSDQYPYSRSRPQIRLEPVVHCRFPKHFHKLQDSTFLELSRCSCCLGRSERIHASLPVSLNPTKNARPIQPHPRRDVFRTMTLLDHAYAHHPHFLQRLVANRIAVLSQKRFAHIQQHIST